VRGCPRIGPRRTASRTAASPRIAASAAFQINYIEDFPVLLDTLPNESNWKDGKNINEVVPLLKDVLLLKDCATREVQQGT
jgi:hypothetical protein